MGRIKTEARTRAHQSLGLAEFQAELESITMGKAALERRERTARRAMLAKVRGIPAADLEDRYYGSSDAHEAELAVNRRAAVHEDDLLAENDIGREVLRLRAEKDNLLDTVWLATSSAQIRTLWTKVSTLLGDEPTVLEREALGIEAVAPG
jgi:hypothetical protein